MCILLSFLYFVSYNQNFKEMKKSKQPIINKEELIDEVGDRNEDMEGYLRNWKSTESTKYAKPIISNPEGLSFIKVDIPFTWKIHLICTPNTIDS